MNKPSLGELLKGIQCNTPECVQELARQAAERGQCTEKDLQLVRDFFHQTSMQFASEIVAGLPPRPVIIGNGENDKLAAVLHTYRWKEGYDIRDATHPYNGIWKPFQAWCDANDLLVHLACQRDSSEKERWYVMSVTPSESLSMPAPHGVIAVA